MFLFLFEEQHMEGNLQHGHCAHYTTPILHRAPTFPVFTCRQEGTFEAARKGVMVFTGGRDGGGTEEISKMETGVMRKERRGKKKYKAKEWKQRVKDEEQVG